jgi:hypothetical protein
MGRHAYLGRPLLRAVQERERKPDRPDTGREKVVATVAASGYCSLIFDPRGLTFSNGALYFLSGARLYRVKP